MRGKPKPRKHRVHYCDCFALTGIHRCIPGRLSASRSGSGARVVQRHDEHTKCSRVSGLQRLSCFGVFLVGWDCIHSRATVPDDSRICRANEASGGVEPLFEYSTSIPTLQLPCGERPEVGTTVYTWIHLYTVSYASAGIDSTGLNVTGVGRFVYFVYARMAVSMELLMEPSRKPRLLGGPTMELLSLYFVYKGGKSPRART